MSSENSTDVDKESTEPTAGATGGDEVDGASSNDDVDNESTEPTAGATGGDIVDDASSNDDLPAFLQALLARLGIRKPDDLSQEEPEHEQVLEEVTFEGIAKYIQSEKCQHIVTMAGAGISTAAGIPDFRTPGSGLYDNLQQYNLPYPEAIFQIGFFYSNPEPFFKLAKELYPGNFKPTTSHYFLRLLNEKGLLLRHYTQNIDTLERIAGVPGEKLVEAHGTFYTAHCLECRKLYTQEWIKNEIFAGNIPKCEEDGCDGVVKPDIVFFGESLPERFTSLLFKDMPKCDLLIIMGTSLAVQPFASLIDRVSETTPRLLVNREKCGQREAHHFLPLGGGGLRFDDPKNYRDVAWLGSCDDGCLALAELLGWKEELVELVQNEHQKIDEKSAAEKQEEKKEELSNVEGEVKSVERQGESKDTKVVDEKQYEQAECVETITSEEKTVGDHAQGDGQSEPIA